MLYRYIPQLEKCAVSIGNFDGMHLGHEYIIRKLIAIAKRKVLRSCVVLFEPQPQQFFAKDNFLRIMSFRDKYSILTQMGVDDVICLRFNAALAKISHHDFYDKIIRNKLGAEAIVVGYDFHFGKNRLGDLDFISYKASVDKVELEVVEPHVDSFGIISSSRIRDLIQNNELKEAARLLGRLYAVEGKVIHGKKLAAKFGFRTANIALDDSRVVANGVYVVKMTFMDKSHYGVANVGIRPTIGGSERLLEVHCFEDLGDIYGIRVRVEFLYFLRNELKFNSIEELQEAIGNDVKIAQEMIKMV